MRKIDLRRILRRVFASARVVGGQVSMREARGPFLKFAQEPRLPGRTALGLDPTVGAPESCYDSGSSPPFSRTCALFPEASRNNEIVQQATAQLPL
jgi:hypothetical protein